VTTASVAPLPGTTLAFGSSTRLAFSSGSATPLPLLSGPVPNWELMTVIAIVFDDETPHELLRRIRPEVLVKGGTYTHEQVIGREVVEAYGGQVRVTGRSKDDLQKAMALLREQDFGIPLQFTNYRG